MKKLFFSLLLLPILATAQPKIDIGTGFGVHYSKAHTAPTSKLFISATVNRVLIEATDYIAIGRSIEPGKLLGGLVGYEAGEVIPIAGYFYNLKTSDHKEMNERLAGAGVRWKRYLGPNGGGILAETMYLSNGNVIATFGITFQF